MRARLTSKVIVLAGETFVQRSLARLDRLPLLTSSAILGEDVDTRRVVGWVNGWAIRQVTWACRIVISLSSKSTRGWIVSLRIIGSSNSRTVSLLNNGSLYLITGVISKEVRSVLANVCFLTVAEDKMVAELSRAGSLVLASRSLKSASTRHLAFASAKRCVS